ncbi:hypothetical protein ACF09H_06295 [Streptomyces sp. NPDC014983]|uniref:hypothetical protein n=1 Tax=Streptomyces sp. NPDC014983 TaxID=3364933 RepID=UPI0036F71C49
MIRLRIQRATWPRNALILTDTPRPNCPQCEGDGGTQRDYGDYETGEYAGTDWDPCDCWNEHRRWTLLPLPRRPRWLHRGAEYRDPWGPGSDEPPF